MSTIKSDGAQEVHRATVDKSRDALQTTMGPNQSRSELRQVESLLPAVVPRSPNHLADTTSLIDGCYITSRRIGGQSTLSMC